MLFRPRLLSYLVRPLFGRSIFRYAPPSASGAALDGLSPAARVLDTSTSAYSDHDQPIHWGIQLLAWAIGFLSAAAYMIWFFKNIFDNTAR